MRKLIGMAVLTALGSTGALAATASITNYPTILSLTNGQTLLVIDAAGQTNYQIAVQNLGQALLAHAGTLTNNTTGSAATATTVVAGGHVTTGNVTNTGSILQTNTAQANTFLSLDGSRTTAGNVIEYKTNNTATFYVNTSGAATFATISSGDFISGYRLKTTGYFYGAQNDRLYNRVAGLWEFRNSADTDYGSLVVKNLTVTNGVILPQLPWIPTNSIPASSSLITNYVMVNLTNTINGGGMMWVATNHSAAGSFVLLKPTMTQTTWP